MASNVVIQTLAVNDQKAGMQGLDKDRINKIIYETSKGSNYFEHQRKRQERIDKRAKEMESSLQDFSDAQRQKAIREMDNLANKLESTRDLTKFITHVDMDAFYAAVEIRDNPTLANKPVAVGGMSMLSTSNYKARCFGVRAAMPGFIAKKLCPELVIVSLNFDKYSSVSKQVSSVLGEYTNEVLFMSLDEAYLDITQCVHERASKHCNDVKQDLGVVADEIVQELREKIFQTTGLTASAGIAPNMMLAKICSDRNKPNGQFRLTGDLESVRGFISELPIRKVSGIGPVQEQLFTNLGIITCHHLWDKRELFPLLFTPTATDFYMRVAMGLGSTCVRREDVRKSIGMEESFREISDPEQLLEKCRELCHDLVDDIVHRGIIGKVMVLKLKNVKFEVTTRNCTLGCHTSDEETIFSACKRLLEREIIAAGSSQLRLRLMGVRLQCLASSSEGTRQRVLTFEKDVKLPEGDSMQCPVCGCTLAANDLPEVNSHVDECLSRQTIKEILSSDKSRTEQIMKRKSSPNKRGKHVAKKCKTGSKSIESYFFTNTSN